jgi:hypothetical protein
MDKHGVEPGYAEAVEEINGTRMAVFRYLAVTSTIGRLLL